MGKRWRRGVFVGVLSMVVAAVGCGGSGKKLDGGPTGGAGSSGMDAATGGAGGNSGTDAATTVQYFQLSWTITSSIDGVTLTCAEAGASSVSVIVESLVFDLPCAPGQGTTGVVPPGSHSVTAELFTASHQLLSQTTSLSSTLQASATRTLPEIDFLVNL